MLPPNITKYMHRKTNVNLLNVFTLRVLSHLPCVETFNTFRIACVHMAAEDVHYLAEHAGAMTLPLLMQHNASLGPNIRLRVVKLNL